MPALVLVWDAELGTPGRLGPWRHRLHGEGAQLLILHLPPHPFSSSQIASILLHTGKINSLFGSQDTT